MARIRSVKPELRTSLTVAEWPREVRYFWVLLWGYFDDHGRGVDDARLVKADCLPLDDDVTRQTIDGWLDLIAGSGAKPLCRYEVGGRRYIHAVNWSEHQKPQHPKDSVVPPCPDHHGSRDPHDSLMKSSGDRQTDFTPEQVVRAGSREQAAQRSVAPEKSSIGAQRIVMDATGCTAAEADLIAERIRTERQPRSLGGLLRTMAKDGDLGPMVDAVRAVALKADVAGALAKIRAGPNCDHGQPGGASLHPTSGEPVCAQCRRIARMNGLNGTARSA